MKCHFCNQEVTLPHRCPLQCEQCGKYFARKHNKEKHQKNCHPGQTFSCPTCQRQFQRKSNRDQHQRLCRRAVPFHGERQFCCHTCQDKFSSRRDLVRHRNRQHGGAEGFDWEPWRGPDGEVDAPLREVMEDNRQIILAPFEIPRVNHAWYNIPVREEASGLEELLDKMDDIYAAQDHAFKINFSLGFVLRHIETGEYRYFAPNRNETLFPLPFVVSNQRSLNILKQKLREENLMEHLKRSRPNSQWKPFLLTNILVDVIPTHYPLGRGNLPDFIKNSKAIIGLEKDHDNSLFEDGLCFFRCLAHPHLKDLSQYVDAWVQFMGSFVPVCFQVFPDLERCFEKSISVYELKSDGTVTPIYESLQNYEDKLYLNLYEKHLSLITDFHLYCKKFSCEFCHKFFTTRVRWKKHQSNCQGVKRLNYVGGLFNPTVSFADEMFERLGERPFFPWFIVYDFESLLIPTEMTQQTIKWTTKHHPISVSICSNVPEYLTPKCFVHADLKELLKEMILYMTDIAQKVYDLASELWDREGLEEDLQKKLDKYKTEVPVLGFNSSKYDMNLIKVELAKTLHLDEIKEYFVVKKNNQYMCLKSPQFRFLDISHYLAPGYSYDKFLKAYQTTQQKSFFPYEWFTSTDKLNVTSLPPIDSFYSSLKQKNTLGDTEEERQTNYQSLLQVWTDKHMTSFKDFLIYYNNLDVEPFVEAVEKMQSFYKQVNIDFLKECVSIPGVARRYLFKDHPLFALFGTEDADLYKTIKKNIIGGPSIIFTRYHEAGKTLIRGKKLCQNIVGYDCNALYLWALGEAMPSGYFVRRQAPYFKPRCNKKYLVMFAWMDAVAKEKKIRILHRLNSGKEFRVGPYLCDGFDPVSKTVYEFDGCWFHGHKCRLTEKTWQKYEHLMEQRRKHTEKKAQYIREQGYQLVTMKECECKSFPVCHYLPPYYQTHKRGLTREEILMDTISGHLFGMIEVDIEVPEEMYDRFQEMSPLFCTCDIPVSAMGEFMKEHIEKYKLSSKPRRLLVGGMKAERILLLTPLLKWYLNHGLVVTQVYQVIEFNPKTCFAQFREEVSEARRKGDVSPDQLLLGDTMKLLGNSAYGSMIMNQEKHQKIEYVKGKDIALKVNMPTFKKLEDLGDGFAEVELVKARQKLNLPIQIGYAILQYAKLKMLEWYYDFLVEFVDRSDFEYIEMDTDSAYFAITGPTLRDVIKKEKRQEFESRLMNYCHVDSIESNPFWFPRECCSKHKAFDRRQSGLFKLEKEGVVMVALCSKTYVLKDKEGFEKTALKGVNKAGVENALEKTKKVLETGESTFSTNKSFRVHQNTIFTYEQDKKGFSQFYCKRKLIDSIHTVPLDLILSPWSRKDCFDIYDRHILSPRYPFRFMIDEEQFHDVFSYLQTLEESTVQVREERALACIECRYEQDHYFKQALLALENFDFVFIDEHYFWGCGQTLRQFRTSDDYPGANMWGFCLSRYCIDLHA